MESFVLDSCELKKVVVQVGGDERNFCFLLSTGVDQLNVDPGGKWYLNGELIHEIESIVGEKTVHYACGSPNCSFIAASYDEMALIVCFDGADLVKLFAVSNDIFDSTSRMEFNSRGDMLLVTTEGGLFGIYSLPSTSEPLNPDGTVAIVPYSEYEFEQPIDVDLARAIRENSQRGEWSLQATATVGDGLRCRPVFSQDAHFVVHAANTGQFDRFVLTWGAKAAQKARMDQNGVALEVEEDVRFSEAETLPDLKLKPVAYAALSEPSNLLPHELLPLVGPESGQLVSLALGAVTAGVSISQSLLFALFSSDSTSWLQVYHRMSGDCQLKCEIPLPLAASTITVSPSPTPAFRPGSRSIPPPTFEVRVSGHSEEAVLRLAPVFHVMPSRHPLQPVVTPSMHGAIVRFCPDAIPPPPLANGAQVLPLRSSGGIGGTAGLDVLVADHCGVSRLDLAAEPIYSSDDNTLRRRSYPITELPRFPLNIIPVAVASNGALTAVVGHIYDFSPTVLIYQGDHWRTAPFHHSRVVLLSPLPPGLLLESPTTDSLIAVCADASIWLIQRYSVARVPAERLSVAAQGGLVDTVRAAVFLRSSCGACLATLSVDGRLALGLRAVGLGLPPGEVAPLWSGLASRRAPQLTPSEPQTHDWLLLTESGTGAVMMFAPKSVVLEAQNEVTDGSLPLNPLAAARAARELLQPGQQAVSVEPCDCVATEARSVLVVAPSAHPGIVFQQQRGSLCTITPRSFAEDAVMRSLQGPDFASVVAAMRVSPAHLLSAGVSLDRIAELIEAVGPRGAKSLLHLDADAVQQGLTTVKEQLLVASLCRRVAGSAPEDLRVEWVTVWLLSYLLSPPYLFEVPLKALTQSAESLRARPDLCAAVANALVHLFPGSDAETALSLVALCPLFTRNELFFLTELLGQPPSIVDSVVHGPDALGAFFLRARCPERAFIAFVRNNSARVDDTKAGSVQAQRLLQEITGQSEWPGAHVFDSLFGDILDFRTLSAEQQACVLTHCTEYPALVPGVRAETLHVLAENGRLGLVSAMKNFPNKAEILSAVLGQKYGFTDSLYVVFSQISVTMDQILERMATLKNKCQGRMRGIMKAGPRGVNGVLSVIRALRAEIDGLCTLLMHHSMCMINDLTASFIIASPEAKEVDLDSISQRVICIQKEAVICDSVCNEVISLARQYIQTANFQSLETAFRGGHQLSSSP